MTTRTVIPFALSPEGVKNAAAAMTPEQMQSAIDQMNKAAANIAASKSMAAGVGASVADAMPPAPESLVDRFTALPTAGKAGVVGGALAVLYLMFGRK